MSEFADKLAQQLPDGWVSKLVWATLGIATFWIAYLVGDYIAPTVAGLVRVVSAAYGAVTNALGWLMP